MRILILIIITVMASCSDSVTKESSNDTNKEINLENNIPDITPEETKKSIAGSWTFYDPKLKMVMDVTYNENGTYNMSLGKTKGFGTWDMKGDNEFTVKCNPKGLRQTSKITKIDEDNLWISWTLKGGKERVIKYTKK